MDHLNHGQSMDKAWTKHGIIRERQFPYLKHGIIRSVKRRRQNYFICPYLKHGQSMGS